MSTQTHHSTVLEVIQEDVQALALDTIVLDDDTGTPDDLARVALLVDLAQTSPLAKNLSVPNLYQVDFVLGTEGLDEFDVLGFGASLNEYAKVSLALVQGLGTLAQATREPIVYESVLKNLLQKDERYDKMGWQTPT